MSQFIDDLFKAQPYSLCIIAGLVLIAVGVVGSIKSYIDPGKYGRMAALGIGVVLLAIGFTLYARQPAAPAASNTPANTSVCTFDAGSLAGTTVQLPETQLGSIGGACHDDAGNKGTLVAPDTPISARRGAGNAEARRAPRENPAEPTVAAAPAAGATSAAPSAPAATPADEALSRVCKFTSGPLAGAAHELPRAQPHAVGTACHDLRGNSGTIVAANTPTTP